MFKNEMFFCMEILNIYIKIHQSFSLIIDHERRSKRGIYVSMSMSLYTCKPQSRELYRYKKENSLMLQNTMFAL